MKLHPPGTEAHARQRLAYWDRRIRDSDAGRDSRDPCFIDLAYRMREMWAGRLTQYEMEVAA